MKLSFTSLLCTVLCLLFLCACSSPAEPTVASTGPTQTESTVTEPPTQAPPPSLIEQGRPWTPEGNLIEIPLTVSEAWKYTDIIGFRDSLLLYGYDTHLSDSNLLSLLLLDPTTGDVLSSTVLSVSCNVPPQVFQDHIYLPDCDSGKVYQLDDRLSVTNQWEFTPQEGCGYIGKDNTLFLFQEDSVYALDLTTGESRLVTTEETDSNAVHSISTTVQIDYRNPDTGLYTPAILELNTGTIFFSPIEGNFTAVNCRNDIWLCSPTGSTSCYYLLNGQAKKRIALEEGSLELLPDGCLLETVFEPSRLTLYNAEGSFLSTCTLSDSQYYYLLSSLIPNETHKGYFLLVQGSEGDVHLLFWDMTQSSTGSDLNAQSLPEPSEALSQLRTRADSLEKKYGISILLGEECPTEYFDFRGEIITDWEEITAELDSMDLALSNYPEGFFRQLKFGSVEGIQICLIQNLEATLGERVGGSYSAFAIQEEDRYTLVFDILSSNEYTYYHELSHVIDQYLFWDSFEGEASLYSEAQWESLNPDDFQYVYSYVDDFYWYDYSYHSKWFIDTYATTFPTEDRARVMEYAMMDYNSYYFQEGTGLYDKLEYYCRCIRDAFDTTGWPEVTPWEQYLHP